MSFMLNEEQIWTVQQSFQRDTNGECVNLENLCFQCKKVWTLSVRQCWSEKWDIFLSLRASRELIGAKKCN